MLLETEIHGVEVAVEYTYCPPVRGARDSTGFQLEPDEPEEILIDSVKTQHCDEIADILFGHPRIWPQLIDKCMSDFKGER